MKNDEIGTQLGGLNVTIGGIPDHVLSGLRFRDAHSSIEKPVAHHFLEEVEADRNGIPAEMLISITASFHIS